MIAQKYKIGQFFRINQTGQVVKLVRIIVFPSGMTGYEFVHSDFPNNIRKFEGEVDREMTVIN